MRLLIFALVLAISYAQTERQLAQWNQQLAQKNLALLTEIEKAVGQEKKVGQYVPDYVRAQNDDKYGGSGWKECFIHDDCEYWEYCNEEGECSLDMDSCCDYRDYSLWEDHCPDEAPCPFCTHHEDCYEGYCNEYNICFGNEETMWLCCEWARADVVDYWYGNDCPEESKCDVECICKDQECPYSGWCEMEPGTSCSHANEDNYFRCDYWEINRDDLSLDSWNNDYLWMKRRNHLTRVNKALKETLASLST